MYDKINYVHGFEEDKEFCVYAEGKDSCVVSFFSQKSDFFFLNQSKITLIFQGDSGGPMICRGGKVAGIVSYGPSECAKAPGIYTNVAFYHKWIVKNMKKI